MGKSLSIRVPADGAINPTQKLRYQEIPREGAQVFPPRRMRPGQPQINGYRLLSGKGAVHDRAGHGETA